MSENEVSDSSPSLNVHIEYCNSCGYKDMVDKLREKIQTDVSEVNVTDSVSDRTAAFEITINDKLVFSRLQSFSYPDGDNIVNLLHDVQSGETIPVIEESSSGCTIL